MTTRLDAALLDISQDPIKGKLRLGVPDDHGRAKLAQIVASFTQMHPQVNLEVTCALSTGFPAALEKSHLDLAVYEVEHTARGEEVLFEDPTCWVQSEQRDFTREETLPVALFDQSCWWRDAAIRSLEERGKPYRIVYSSQSLSGVMAAVEAGISVGLLGRTSLRRGLSVAAVDFGFGTTPTSKLVLTDNKMQSNEPLAAMKRAVRATFLNN